MSTFTYQIIKDSTKQTVIKLTGEFTNTTNESNVARIAANTLYRPLDANNNLLISGNTAKPYYGLSVYRVWYDVSIPSGHLTLSWSGDNTYPIITMSGRGEYNSAGNWLAISNPISGANVNGNIGISSYNAAANASYSIIIELHKDNNYYDSGKLIEPSAFNYGRYGVTP